MDAFGEHALTCAYSRGELQRRAQHARLRDRGVHPPHQVEPDLRCKERRVFEAHGGRPAGIWVQTHPVYHTGQAIDCTIVSAAANAGAKSGYRRRALTLEVRDQGRPRPPRLGFEPFAVDLNGAVGRPRGG